MDGINDKGPAVGIAAVESQKIAEENLNRRYMKMHKPLKNNDKLSPDQRIYMACSDT